MRVCAGQHVPGRVDAGGTCDNLVMEHLKKAMEVDFGHKAGRWMFGN